MDRRLLLELGSLILGVTALAGAYIEIHYIKLRLDHHRHEIGNHARRIASLGVSINNPPEHTWRPMEPIRASETYPIPLSKVERAIAKRGRPMTRTELVEATRMTLADVTRLVLELHEKGRIKAVKTRDADRAWELAK